MPQSGKSYRKSASERERKLYPLTDAVALVKKIAYAKFNETVEIAMRLGVDPKHADQMVRGTVVLPNGLGRSKRVIAITSGDKVKEAREAGADEVGGDRDRAQGPRGGQPVCRRRAGRRSTVRDADLDSGRFL